MDQVWINVDQRGSTWINCLQPVPSACRFSMSLQPAAVRPDSWLMRHASDSWLMRHASGVRRQASGVRRQASGVRRHASHASGVRRQASCVRRQASDSWLMRQASCVPRFRRPASGVMRQTSGVRLMRQTSGVRLMAHASCVRRQTPRPSFSPFSRRPLSVMTTTQRRHFPHATPFRFAPIALYGMG